MWNDVERRRVRLPETGIEIALLDWGGGGPLALLHHANGFCAALWALVAEKLRGRFRVVAMDARGHGDSSKPDPTPDAYAWSALAGDLRAVAEHLAAAHGDGRIALGLGHSFGGTLTLAVAAQLPRLYERIALVDPVILPPMNPEEARAHTGGSGLAERARKRRHDWASREEARAFFAERELFADWDPRALDLYVREGLRDRDDGGVELKCSGATESTIFGSAPHFDCFALAPDVAVPVQILRAARGNFPREVYDDLASRLRRVTLEEIDTGHLAVMEKPDLVADAVLRFAQDG